MASTDYVFTRDYLDNNRINLQHYIWRDIFGYLTHPDVPTQDPNLRIADVGTGTGQHSRNRIWLTNLAHQLPQSVQLDGLDISFNATPPPKWLPTNMTLRHWNVKEDVPEDLTGVYDIVHIRTFVFVLQSDDINHVLGNLVKLLKPGGYIQWGEPDVASLHFEKTNPDNKEEALLQLRKISQGQDPRLDQAWVPNLPALFSDHGLEKVKSDVQDAPHHLGFALHECNLLIHELIARKTQNEAVAKAVKDLMPEVSEETKGGVYWAFTRWTVIGRKPLLA